jgi:hypothetical protein
MASRLFVPESKEVIDNTPHQRDRAGCGYGTEGAFPKPSSALGLTASEYRPERTLFPTWRADTQPIEEDGTE